MSGTGPDGPEWTDPAADYHRDLTVLTAAVRGELDKAVRTVNATLGMNRQAAPQGLTRPCCRRKCRVPCGRAARRTRGPARAQECQTRMRSSTRTHFLRQGTEHDHDGVRGPRADR